MLSLIILHIISLVSAALYIFFDIYNEHIKLQLIFKPLPVIVCMITGLLRNNIPIFLCLGFLFCSIGDILLILSMKNKKMFIYGVLSFLIGHINYILSFSLVNYNTIKINYDSLILCIILLILCKMKSHILKIYFFVLSYLVIDLYLNINKLHQLIRFIGGFIFLISDCIICMERYNIIKLQHYISSLLIMILYYLAQYMFLISLLIKNYFHVKD